MGRLMERVYTSIHLGLFYDCLRRYDVILFLFVAFSFLLFASVYGYLFVCPGALFSLCLCGPRAF